MPFHVFIEEADWLDRNLSTAVVKLDMGLQRELASAIKRANCDPVWFDDIDVIKNALDWVTKKIDAAPGFDIPPGVLQVRRAVRAIERLHTRG